MAYVRVEEGVFKIGVGDTVPTETPPQLEAGRCKSAPTRFVWDPRIVQTAIGPNVTFYTHIRTA